MNIREKKEALEKILSDARVILKQLRNECPHAVGFYEYKGNSGNWCESDNTYWKELICSDCGAFWIEDHKVDGQRNPAYHDNPAGEWEKKR